MPSFGEKLKKEREKRKITLEQISVSTKIGTRMLQAMEEDKFNQLPGGIFNKGFVRAYARCIGLDEDQTVADYLEASGDARPVSTEIAARESDARNKGAREKSERESRLEAVSDTPSRPLPWGVFAAILLVVALALSFWSHRRQQLTKLVNHGTSTTTMPSSGEVAGGSASSALPSSTAPSSASDSAPSTNEAAAAKVPLADANALSSASPNAAAPAGEFVVVIHAREESWITMTIDGKKLPAELLSRGSERAIRGQKEITVKAGNAGGVDFLFNGKKLNLGGEFGEVKVVTFGPSGIVANPAAAPSTP